MVTDRGPTLIISKSVFKYGIKINAGEKNYVLHRTGNRISLILNVTLQVQ